MIKKLLLGLALATLTGVGLAQSSDVGDPLKNFGTDLNGGDTLLAGGTVTSITLTCPDEFSVFGTNPVTTFGTLGCVWASGSAPSVNDSTLISVSNVYVRKLLTDCDAADSAVTYDVTTHAWGCHAISSAAGAPTDATYIMQTANASTSAEQALSSLSTGIMRVATTTGVITSLTDSSGISGNLSDETGSGALVFGTSPSMVTPVVGNGSTSAGSILFKEDSDNGTNSVTLIGPASTADVTLTLPSVTGTVVSSGDSATAMSVYGRSANSSGVRADIAGTLAGQSLYINSTPALAFDNWFMDTKNVMLDCEFIDIPSNPGSTCSSTVSGTGAATARVTGTTNNPGLISIETGTTTTGMADIWMGYNSGAVNSGPFLFGGGVLEMKSALSITTLSDGTDTFIAQAGFCDTDTSGVVTATTPCTDGVGFQYAQATDTHWRIYTCSNTTCTRTNTTNTVTAGQQDELYVSCNAAGTSCSFYIDGVEVSGSPIATNIPTGAGRASQPKCGMMIKSAGTTSRFMQLDVCRVYQRLTTAR